MDPFVRNRYFMGGLRPLHDEIDRAYAASQQRNGRRFVGPYTCKLATLQCYYLNRETNRRCRRQVGYGLPLCYQHMHMVYGVRIGQTSLRDATGRRLPFRGLFACRVFQNKERICPYIGLNVDANNANNMRRAADARWAEMGGIGREGILPYAVSRGRGGAIVDPACVRGVAAFANTELKRLCNADIHAASAAGSGFPALVATKRILPGQEILVNYGATVGRLYRNTPNGYMSTIPSLDRVEHKSCR